MARAAALSVATPQHWLAGHDVTAIAHDLVANLYQPHGRLLSEYTP